MRVIIAGSRTINLTVEQLDEIVDASGFDISEVVSGMAAGVDTSAVEWANAKNVPVKKFPADWLKYGKAAGPVRNRIMANYGQALIAVTNGSKGTAHMIKCATEKKMKVYIKDMVHEQSK